MLQLFMLADDLTGALDAGVHFASSGKKTTVICDPQKLNFFLDADMDVLIIDTETRHLPPEKAYEIVYQIVKTASQKDIPYIYKKTDSALRGNIGAELSATLDASSASVLTFIPSFPRMNRISKNGILYIDEQPVSESIFAHDPLNPVTESSIAALIGQQSTVPVLSNVSKEQLSPSVPSIIAYDAVSMEDIAEVVAMLADTDQLKLTAGCAAFAEVLSGKLPAGNATAQTMDFTTPLPVLCGSLNAKTYEQIDYAVTKGFSQTTLRISSILDDDYLQSEEWSQLSSQIFHTLASGSSVILNTESTLNASGEEIAAQMGRIGYELLKNPQLDRLYIIGGDTLFGFIHASGISSITPICTVDTGVVISQIILDNQPKYLISKSGGLGSKQAIYDISHI